ncbi:MAG: SDR family NAD(P)-dependent oxidoreductase, partial [Candidatus Dormibacteraceae bacterium]
MITGSSQGFGRAVARAFAAEGASVVLCARDPMPLEEARTELAGLAVAGARVLAVPADVSNPADVRQVVDRARGELGGLDVLVSNAAVHGPKGPIDEVPWEEWSRAIAINLLGTVLACRAVLPIFKARRHGKIVLLSGGGATRPFPFLSAYAASKAGVARFGETLAEEVRAVGIDVNAVAPGAMTTRLLDQVLEAGPEKVGAALYQQSVKQKAEGGAGFERGAALCVFLAS